MDRSKHKSVESAVIEAVRVAGSSITVTSITDFCAFVAGSFITIPALSSFCLFSAAAVMVDFLFQTTAFVAWMTLDMKKAEERNGVDCCCSCCCCCPGAKASAVVAPSDSPPKRDTASEFWSGPYADVILHPFGKVVILLIAAGLLIVGIIGCMSFQMDFETE